MKWGNLHFLWCLWLIPAIILFYIWAFKRKLQLINNFVSDELREKLLAGVSFGRQKFKAGLLIFVVVFAIVALIRPKWGHHWEEVTRRGVDIMLALDVSKSMLAKDVAPDRLKRAKREIIDLLRILEGDRIGLVAFAGTAFLQTPLTLDYGAVQIFLDDLDTDLIPIPGTAIAQAIEKATESFDQGDRKSRVLILITDGEDHQGKPIEAAKKAAEKGIRIYAIGIGQEGGAPIPDENGGFKKDVNGDMILTHLDEDMLRKLALETGGSYIRSTTGDFDLEKIYSDILKNVEEKELKSGKRKHYEERFQWPLLIALLLLVLEAILPDRKRKFFFRFKKGKAVSGAAGALMILVFFPIKTKALTFLPGKQHKAEKLYKEGKYDKALNLYIDAQIERPKDYDLQYNTANSYYKMKDYEKAETLYGQVAANGPLNLAQKSHYNLGNTFFRQGKLQEAVDSYKKAIELDPKDENAKANLEFVRSEIKRRLEEQKKRQDEQQKQQNENQQNGQQGEQQDSQQQQAQNQQGQQKTDSNQSKDGQDQQQEQDQQQKMANNNQDQQQMNQGDQENNKDQPDEKNDDQQAQGVEKSSENPDKENNEKEENQGYAQQDQNEDKKNEGEKEQNAQAMSSGNSKEDDKSGEKGNEMSEQEAMQWLSTLQEDRKKFLKRRLQGQRSKGHRVQKDW